MSESSRVLLETRRFRVVQVDQPLADGSTRPREIVRHPGAVTILPLVDDFHVCLIRNYRPAVGQTLIELPAGTLDPGEEPLATARRELTEETGYSAEQWDRLHAFYLSPGILDERMHLFLARGLTVGTAAREPGEQIENLVVPWEEAIAMIDDQRIHDAKTIVGLLYYDRWRRQTPRNT